YFSLASLSNGNFIIGSPGWNGRRGAVTWINSSTGISGIISEANSLVGSTPGDSVGARSTLTALSNGNYVVVTPRWNEQRGALTWGNGNSGVNGILSEANSLVGSAPGDQIGSSPGVIALSNGNYVVSSLSWNGTRGAATWFNGNTGI